MNNDIKTAVGFLIPVAALIGFVLSLVNGNYLSGVLMAVAGILGWFVYMAVMESSPPSVTGNLIILFGILLSLAVFLNYGWTQDMFGGFIFKTDGSILSLIILFFSILLGVVFRGNLHKNQPALTPKEKAMVEEAISQESYDEPAPKVIVVKQEAPSPAASEEKEDEEFAEFDYSQTYAYPPEYYYDEEDWEEEEEDED